MLNKSNTIKNILWVFLGGGGLVYMNLALFSNFNYALFSLVITLFTFVIFSLILDLFNIKEFIIILSTCGIILSITTFFYYGVEEVAYPYGAILFHFEGILKSLIVLFVSLLPILFLYKGNDKVNNRLVVDYNDSEWEVATSDDLDSGQYDL